MSQETTLRQPEPLDEIAGRVSLLADVSVRRMAVGACLEARARGLLVVVMPEGDGFLVAEARNDATYGEPPDYVLSSADDVVAAVSFLLGDAENTDHPTHIGCQTPPRSIRTL